MILQIGSIVFQKSAYRQISIFWAVVFFWRGPVIPPRVGSVFGSLGMMEVFLGGEDDTDERLGRNHAAKTFGLQPKISI